MQNCSAPARAGRSAGGRAGSPPVPLREADLHPVSTLGSFQESSACGIRNVFKLAFSVGVHLRRLTQTMVSVSFLSSADCVWDVAVPRWVLHPSKAIGLFALHVCVRVSV